MIDIIAAARRDDSRTGEESGLPAGHGSRRWLVDPLCGTANFAAETPLVAVNVALLEGTATLAAVSADPIAGQMFWTDGRSAWLRQRVTDDPLRPASVTRLVDVNATARARAFLGPQLLSDASFRALFGPRVLSTTLALAWVAAGTRAAYVSDGLFRDNQHVLHRDLVVAAGAAGDRDPQGIGGGVERMDVVSQESESDGPSLAPVDNDPNPVG